MCKSACPVYSVVLKETVSPRGLVILANKNQINNIFLMCTLCKACDFRCPAGVKPSEIVLWMREKLVNVGDESKGAKKMMENIRKYGNPYGEVKKGSVPDELYCC